jgi:predicted ATPase
MTERYQLGPFRLDPDAGLLTRDGGPAGLGARAVAVLRTLVERANECVPKARIFEVAWPGLVVEESNLAAQILAIRRVLGQAGGGRWIETLPRRGYRFVGPVRALREARAAESTSPTRSNLPEPLTSFVGRERELAEIKRLLATRRLLTLLGVGGIGKTRLALQLGAEVVDAYRDGVWLVDLASLADPALVPSAVAQVLGVREGASEPLADMLCACLKRSQLLLILDNCEHVLGECARLAEATLRQAGGLTILATSREPLRVQGEQIYPLPALSLPDPSASADSVQRSEAVRLFVERAQRQQPGFALTPGRARAVAELCIHLDGIPLALELAAARMRSLSVEQILARLGDRFRLLTAESRTALPRQQTLRAALDWSFDLLTEGERAVLTRLAVFAGGFTLEATAAVASDATIAPDAVSDLVGQLVSRSLVIVETGAPQARYRLLETTRAYAQEKLAESGEAEAIRRRHARYFSKRFEHTYEDWLRMRDTEWDALYRPELDNLRAALDWSMDAQADPVLGVRLCAGSASLWWRDLALRREGRERVQAALASMGPGTSELDQARLWFWRAFLKVERPQAAEDYQRAAALYRRARDAAGAGISLHHAAAELAYTGQLERASPLFAEALPLLESAALPKALAEYFRSFGNLKMLAGDFAGARANFEKGLALCREAGADSLEHSLLASLAELAWMTGDLDTALATYGEAISLARRWIPAGMTSLGIYLTNLAGVRTERGELDEALAVAREGLPLRRQAWGAWGTLDHLALRAALAGKIGTGARLAGYADRAWMLKEATRQPNEARARGRLQSLLRERLSPPDFERLLAEGAKLSEEQACRLALEE